MMANLLPWASRSQDASLAGKHASVIGNLDFEISNARQTSMTDNSNKVTSPAGETNTAREHFGSAVRRLPGTRNPYAALPGRQAGFTLIELMVTVGLLVILLYMLMVTFSSAQRSFADTRATVDAHQNARAMMETIRADLSSATLIRLQPPNVFRFEGLANAPAAGFDTVKFTTTAFQASRSVPGSTSPTRPQIVEIRYRVDNKTNTLMKAVDWDNDTTTENYDPEEAVGFNVIAFGLRYFDPKPASGLPTWATNGAWMVQRMPAAVEVSFTVRSRDSRGNNIDNIFSEIVYLQDWQAK
jgi:prepilin-type N-terminal cleavage/methylation domain-containing protein